MEYGKEIMPNYGRPTTKDGRGGKVMTDCIGDPLGNKKAKNNP